MKQYSHGQDTRALQIARLLPGLELDDIVRSKYMLVVVVTP